MCSWRVFSEDGRSPRVVELTEVSVLPSRLVLDSPTPAQFCRRCPPLPRGVESTPTSSMLSTQVPHKVNRTMMLENLFALFQDKELETGKTPLSHVKQKLVQAIFKTVVNSIILKDSIIFF